MQRRAVLLLPLLCFLALWVGASQAHAAAGEILWSFPDPQGGKQEALAAAVDGQGRVAVTGFAGIADPDLLTVLFKADGSGVAWRAPYGPTLGTDKGVAVAVDGNGDVVVAGFVRDGTDDDFLTIKYAAADGSVLWQHRYDPSGNGDDRPTAVAVDALDNIYVGGYSPAAGGAGPDDFLLIKYGPAGPVSDQPMWAVRYDGGFGGHDRILGLAVGGGAVAVTGTSQNATDFDALTVKFDTDKNFLWEHRYGHPAGGDDQTAVVRLDGLGNVLVAGYGNNTVDHDLYLAKYAAATGSAVTGGWEATLDSGHNEQLTDLVVDVAGDAYVTGYTDTLTGAGDIYVARYAGADGSRTWYDIKNTTNGNVDQGVGIAVDEFGDVFVTASSYVEATTQYDMLTLKYKRTGGFLWAVPYVGPGGHNDRPVWIGQAPTGEIRVAGWTDAWTAGASDYNLVVLTHDPGLLNAPTELAATTVSETAIDLVWSDNSSAPDEEFFSIERRDGVGAWAERTTVPQASTGFSDTGLTPHTLYTYRVRAYTTADGYSHYSNESGAKTTVVTYQDPAWTFTYDHGSQDEAAAVAVGPDGYPVATGHSLDAVSSFDYYTVKLDRGGNEIWHARYTDDDDQVDMAEALVVDGLNRVVVTGYSYLFAVGAMGNTNDLWTLGYPSTGPTGALQPNWTWGHQYNGPAGDDDRSNAIAAATDGSDHVAVVGYGKNASGNDDIYVLKYAPDGTVLWPAVPYDGGGNDYPTAVAFDPGGNVLVVGYTHDGTGYDYFVAKYRAADGVREWTHTYGGPGDGSDYGNDYAESVVCDAAGRVYVTGTVVAAGGDTDFYTLCLDAAGNAVPVWDHPADGPAHGDDQAAGVALDPLDGTVVVGGTQLAAAGNGDFTVLRYAADGTFLDRHALERPEADAVWAMAVDGSGLVSLAGQTDNGADLDMLAAKFDHQGLLLGATVVAGAGGQDDVAAGVTASRFGETFVAGYTTNAAGNSDYVVFPVPDTTLPVPSPLTASAAFTTVDLTWADNAGGNDGYDVERKVDACAAGGTWSGIHTAAADGAGYTDSGLSVGGTTYCYWVRAFRNSGEVSRWVEAEATTRVPVPVSDLAAAATSTTDIDLTWTDTTDGVAEWEVWRCVGGGCSSFTRLLTLPAGSASYSDATLQDGTTYRYQVNGVATGWSTGAGNIAADTTPAPVAPTGLTVTRVAENQLDLGWAEVVPDETAFVVERCEGAGCTTFVDLPVSLGAGTTAYSDQTVQPNLTYRYRVRAQKVTAWHTWNSATTNESEQAATAPAPVLTASASNTTRVALSWTNTTASETGFQVERCTGTSAACTATPVFAPVGGSPTTGANGITYNDTAVGEGQTYTYRVRAVGDTPAPWTSADTAWRQVSTPAAKVPTGFNVSAVSESQVEITWSDSNNDEEGFRVQRCVGVGCTSGYVQVGSNQAPGASGSYTDTGVAFDTTYGYLVEVYKDLPAQPWTRATAVMYATPTLDPPNLTNATASVGTDCAELRFSAVPDGSTVLDYWIELGCGGPDTRVEVELPSLAVGATDLYVFTGNPGAAPASDGFATFPFFDDFRGPAIDGTKWYQYGDGAIAQNDDLVLSYISAGYTRALVSKATFTRSTELELYMRLTVPDVTIGSTDECRIGWYRNYTGANTSYIAQAFNWYRGTLYGMDYAYNRATFGAYMANTDYQIRIPLEAAGAQYWIKGGPWADWTTVTDTASYNFTPLRVGILQSGHRMNIHAVAVRKIAAVVPTVVAGAEVSGSYALPGGTWGRRQTLAVTNGGAALANYPLPVSVDTSTLQSDQVALTWTDTTEGETGFVIERCLKIGDSCNSAQNTGFDTSFSVGPNVTTYTDTTVASGGNTYQYRVKAVTTLPWTETPYSNVLSATTVDPPIPGNLSVAATGETTVNLAWDDTTANETRFTLERCQVGADCPTFTPLAATAPFSATGFVDDTVCPSGQYTYRVTAEREGVWTAGPSNATTGTTLAPDAPTGLIATALSESEIQLTWIPQTVDEAGFTVERCDGACVPLDVPGNGVTSYTDSGLAPSTTYTYRVKAYGATCGWESAYSSPAMGAQTGTPPAPSGLVATVANTTQINLAWHDESGSETQYHVYRCTGAGCTPTVEISVPPLAQDSEAYTDLDVAAGTTYVYKVEAHKAVAPEWRTSVQQTTTTTSPDQPLSLSATKTSEVELDLHWTYTQKDETGFTVERCEGSGCSGFAEIAQIPAGSLAYTDTAATGLAANRHWRYRVSPVKTGIAHPWNPLPYSAPADADTLPIVPSGVAAGADNTTEVTVTWTPHTPTATGFEVWRCAGVGCSSGFLQVGTPAASPFTDTAAQHSTPYGYQVRAVGPGWNGTECVSAVAPATTPTPQAPILQPITVVSDTSLVLTWTIQTADETGFTLERCATGVGQNCSNFTVTEPALPAAVDSYAELSAQASTGYCYRVGAFKTATHSWGPLSSNTVCAALPPAAAGAPALTALTSRMIQVDWTAPSVDETGFDVEVKAWNGRFVKAGSVGPDVTTYVDTRGLEPETAYTYRVVAFRGADRSPPSGENAIVTPDLSAGDETCRP